MEREKKLWQKNGLNQLKNISHVEKYADKIIFAKNKKKYD